MKKRNIIGSIVFGVGLGSVVLGILRFESLPDSNLVRIIIGLLLMITGMSVLFSRSDREAGRHARQLWQKLSTRETSTPSPTNIPPQPAL